ncbi:OB-fold nucleic acid binding domain-containing protein [Methanocaldococcus infernus]
MKIHPKNLTLPLLLIFILSSFTYLYFFPPEPTYKKIAEVKEDDYVILRGDISKIYAKKNKYNEIEKIYKIRIIDDSGDIDIVAFGKVREELTKYIKEKNILEGDYVEVKGKVSVYKGRYQIILRDIKDFKLLLKKNFEDRITLAKNKTNIYASKYSKIYHTNKDCPYGKKIKEDNKIYFYSEEDALNLGYRKCKWCSEKDKE